MKRVKTRTFFGVVCVQTIYNVADNANLKTCQPRPRFKTEEERILHRLQQARKAHARQICTNYKAGDLYVTLTLNNDYEVHTFEEARRIRDNYYNRLKRVNPDAKIHIYMGRGKGTHRIHFHMIAHGLSKEVIYEKWGMGTVVRIDELKEHNYYNGIDHGQDFTGLANYLYDHWTSEQGGQHYKASRNMTKVVPEKATVCKRTYTKDKPPIAPKGYKLVDVEETTFGYLSFKYVRIPAPHKKRRRKAKE